LASRGSPLRLAASDAFHLGRELWWNLFDTPRRTRRDFDAAFAASRDPWDYQGAAGHERHHRALALLDLVPPGSVDDALEIGCAEGQFTELLTTRCQSVVAVDISPIALERARVRRDWGDAVTFGQWDLRVDPLPDRFSLVVVMDVLDHFGRPSALRAARTKLVDALRPGGWLLLGNSRQSELFEQRWWGGWLVRGGRRIEGYVAAHPLLERVAAVEGGFYTLALLRRQP
jgi:SAM-dependent methyltransferase